MLEAVFGLGSVWLHISIFFSKAAISCLHMHSSFKSSPKLKGAETTKAELSYPNTYNHLQCGVMHRPVAVIMHLFCLPTVQCLDNLMISVFGGGRTIC